MPKYRGELMMRGDSMLGNPAEMLVDPFASFKETEEGYELEALSDFSKTDMNLVGLVFHEDIDPSSDDSRFFIRDLVKKEKVRGIGAR